MQFNESIVFVVGGGGYVEYTNLLEWASHKNGMSGAGGAGGRDGVASGGGAAKKITYGSTEIMTPTAFLRTMAELGKGV